MSRLDQLPADQKAVLQLLLKQGRSYDDIAGLLQLERRAVRERALGALHALGAGAGADLPPDRQDQVADHLLGQQDPDQHAATRRFLAGSAPGRRWASAVAAELAPIAPAGLPDLPAEHAEAAGAEAGEEPAGSRRLPGDPASRSGGPAPRSSRLGGAVLVLALLLAAGIGAFLLLRSDDPSAASDEPATSQAAPAAPQDGVEAQVTLAATRAGGNAAGAAAVVVSRGTRGLAVAGQDLRPGDYAVWLYTSRTETRLLGFAPRVTGNGVLSVVARSIPEDYARFRELVISRERVTEANRDAERTQPGTIVLRGEIGEPPAAP
ncbi:MAG: hypothetical protein AVDCRST_MAG13-2143 [uncultured Solirubrobacteraceae bacterium]|uniref:RNA polymerase sigma factor 70 region 4 type 2 domain-containing protein n=1 Tax=uncultured Solirubrobacteraceae bacterium TaxID=1162706 RepID=A0A6J4SI19_9ACTN|nr:MAG: hypothetical protein AVDCRST_MAG13-2143 [uncultured Solirubrobacteraceae bacterium]